MVILHVYIACVCVWWVWVWVWIRGVPSLLQTRYKQAVSIMLDFLPRVRFICRAILKNMKAESIQCWFSLRR